MPLSESQRLQILQDWRLISARRDQVAVAIFLRLFELQPSAQSLFPRFRRMSQHQMLQSAAVRSQGLRLLGVIDSTVDDLANGGEVEPTGLKAIGMSHARMNVKEPHFEAMKAAMLEVFDAVLQLSQEGHVTWQTFIDDIVQIVIQSGNL